MKILHIFIKPWFLVLVGVLLTVLSALVTHYVVDQNNDKISSINTQISSISNNIDNLWQEVQTLEQKENFTTIITLLAQDLDNQQSKVVHDFVEDTFKNLSANVEVEKKIEKLFPLHGKDETIWLRSMFEIVDFYKKATVEGIDTLYIEKINLEKQKNEISDQNSILANIALFLQIMGLILVLAKDVAR